MSKISTKIELDKYSITTAEHRDAVTLSMYGWAEFVPIVNEYYAKRVSSMTSKNTPAMITYIKKKYYDLHHTSLLNDDTL